MVQYMPWHAAFKPIRGSNPPYILAHPAEGGTDLRGMSPVINIQMPVSLAHEVYVLHRPGKI